MLQTHLKTIILALNKNVLILSLFLKFSPIRSVVSSCKCQKDLATLNIIFSSHWQKCALLLFLKILYPSTLRIRMGLNFLIICKENPPVETAIIEKENVLNDVTGSDINSGCNTKLKSQKYKEHLYEI